ncbi:hypothetical protein M2447_001551 [Ereboglobus sp. PH5-10]|uniref:hypothetical protein n=1 Tax=Ereboglobus sp. PH5-10 TaxID=2940629 RepID=UPI00240575AF|nr:hypothetical protein [Ereboglobus sp. PH5-10]MDF9827458.1 hypothetical protein [Ereboglobus sp. PH5-10]
MLPLIRFLSDLLKPTFRIRTITNMQPRRATALVFFAVLAGLGIRAPGQAMPTAQPEAPPPPAASRTFVFGAENNLSPFWVGRAEPGNPLSRANAPAASWNAIGPLIFRQPLVARPRYDDGAVVARGFRPLYVEKRDASGQLLQFHVLYPLFNWRKVKDDGYRWDIFNLINHEHGPATRKTAAHDADNQFDVWPFYFSNNTGDPATSYRAVFPVYGNVSGRLLQDRLGWFLFPIYGWSERNGTTSRAVLWPIFRRTTGGGADGWKVWPLFGRDTKNDIETGAPLYKNTFVLWPFYFNNTTWNRDNPAADPARALAVLPFYYRETAPGFRSDSYMLFWGRSRRVEPYVYSENRYFWPLFVQGRGPEHRVNRWAPFYTYSNHKGREKTWVMWPLWNHKRTDDTVNSHVRKRFFYFLYNSVSQKPLVPPGATPAQKAAIDAIKPARKISLWPFYTYWTDGRGRKQLQALSPFEVFLPQNEPTRLIYTPLFALYRYEQEAPGRTRHSFLWNVITHRREPGLREFHVGPIYSGERVGGHKRRALFRGVVGAQKTPGIGWRPFAFRFKSLQRQLAEASNPAAAAPAKPARVSTTPPMETYPKVRTRR